jgi:hypothetical protein
MQFERLKKLLGIGAILLSAPGAYANLLTPPGGTTAPSDYSVTTGTELVAFTGLKLLATASGFGSAGGTNIAGDWKVGVGTDSTTGDLDFLYEFTTTSSIMEHFNASNFAPTLVFPGQVLPSVGVGYVTTVAALGLVAGGAANIFVDATTMCGAAGLTPCTPIDAGWDGAGQAINFDWKTDFVPVGQTSAIELIRTNATTYDTGGVSWADGLSFVTTAFDPAPEPAFAGLLLGSLFAVCLFVARKFRAA